MGRNLLAEKIETEALHLVRYLQGLKGQAKDIKMVINMSIGNVLCNILLGKRYGYDDKTFLNLMEMALKYFKTVVVTNLVNYFPFLIHLPGDLFGTKVANVSTAGIVKFFVEYYVQHLREEEAGSDKKADDMITAYLHEKKSKIDAGRETLIDDENIVKNVAELFTAGTETTSTTILWGILYLIRHPDVQRKVHAELEREIGSQRVVKVQDRSKLPYLTAVIMETQRFSRLVPFTFNACAETTEVRGYTIPRGATLLVNLESVLMDKELWGDDVNSFRPERFLDKEGKVCVRKELIPFSVGKRACLGESLARMELFLYFAILLQNFLFLPDDSLPPQTGVFGLTISPEAFQVRAVSRTGNTKVV